MYPKLKLSKTATEYHDRHHLSYYLVEKLTGESFPKEKKLEKFNRLSYVAHFLNLTDLLRENNIWFACMKGPMLSYRIHGDATVRLSNDIDLLLRPEDINKVRLLVLANGYISKAADWPVALAAQKKTMKLQHHVSFVHEESKFAVEFHWRLSAYTPISQKNHEAQLARNYTEIFYNNRSFTVLSKEFELMYLILHGSVHAWFRLKWLTDIMLYPIGDLDNTLFLQLIKRYKLQKALDLTSNLLQVYFQHKFFENECDHPSKKLVVFCQDKIESQKFEYSSTKEIIHNQFYQTQLFPSLISWKKRMQILWIRPGDLLEYNFKYIWLYYLIRPISFIRRRGFKQGR